MRLLRLNPDSAFKKSAKVVGDVMGSFHPHGDQAIYDALVRLAQDFAVRYPLVDGQGNFGNVDGDNAAAMRYTESRLTDAAGALLEGLDEDAIDFRATYDGEGQEPVVLPARVDRPFVDWLAALALQKVVVLHANHANELDADVDRACARLRDAGATVLNQAVLLRGVNDDAAVLAALSERLFAAGVLPYYLHQMDRVQGAAHFEVPDDRALALVAALRARLPGYLVPRLVREVAGDDAKRPL